MWSGFSLLNFMVLKGIVNKAGYALKIKKTPMKNVHRGWNSYITFLHKQFYT